MHAAVGSTSRRGATAVRTVLRAMSVVGIAETVGKPVASGANARPDASGANGATAGTGETAAIIIAGKFGEHASGTP